MSGDLLNLPGEPRDLLTFDKSFDSFDSFGMIRIRNNKSLDFHQKSRSRIFLVEIQVLMKRETPAMSCRCSLIMLCTAKFVCTRKVNSAARLFIWVLFTPFCVYEFEICNFAS